MRRSRFFISTIDPCAADLARRFGLGLELAQFCTAWNLDENRSQTHAQVQAMLTGVGRPILHGPFNELYPCAIDPKARALAAERFAQAVEAARKYQAFKVVFHGGYNPYLYYKPWFQERSVEFWKEFIGQVPDGMDICLENVLEPEPEWLTDILKAVDDPRLRLCLDVGHVNAYSDIPAGQWLEACAPWLSHVHLHNNDGSADTHSALTQGSLPIERLLEQLERLCPEATVTLEIPEAEQSIRFLEGLLKE